MDEFLTLEMLTQFPILVLVVVFITEFTKDLLDKMKHIPTKYFVYLYALVLLLLVKYFTEDLTAVNVVLAILNGFVVALAAMKGYEEVKK